MDWQAGKFIGRYALVRLLGQGGQGAVWLAEDPGLRRLVAIKILTMGPMRLSAFARFQREAEIASRLSHPGICTIYDAADDEGVPYIVMQYVEGETLSRLIAGHDQHLRDESTQMDDGDTLMEATADANYASREFRRPSSITKEEVLDRIRIAEESALALQCAHEAGIIHRDVKPSNIMVTPEGRPVVLDFGLARLENSNVALTRTGELFGTPAYLAPETLREESMDLDARADIYALGATLYEAVTGAPPFRAPTRAKLHNTILEQRATPPSRKNPNVPRDLDLILDTALQKDPDHRYRTARDFADDLRALQAGEPIAASPVSKFTHAFRWCRRHPGRTALIAGLVLALGTAASAGGYLYARLPELQEIEEIQQTRDAEVHLESGFLYLECHEAAKAESAFLDALQIDPDSLEAIVGLALTAYGELKYEKTLAILDRYPVLEQSTANAFTLRIPTLRQLGRNEEADALKLRTAVPDSSVGFLIAALNCMFRVHSGETAAAREALSSMNQALVHQLETRSIYLFQWAHAIGHTGDAHQAEAADQAIASLVPETHRSWFWRGFAHWNTNYPRAIECLKKSIQLDDELITPRLNLAILLRRDGRPSEAVDILREILAVNSDLGAAHRELGQCLNLMGNATEAKASFLRAFEISPNDIRSGTELVRFLVDVRDFKSALKPAQHLSTLWPNDADIHWHLAFIQERSGHHQDAIASYKRVIELDPKSATSHNNLGVMHKKLGAMPEARAAWNQAIRVQPSLIQPYANLIKDLLANGKLAEAIALSERCAKVLTRYRSKDRGMAWIRHARLLREHLGKSPEATLETLRYATFRSEELVGAHKPEIMLLKGIFYLENGESDVALRLMTAARKRCVDDKGSPAALRRIDIELRRAQE